MTAVTPAQQFFGTALAILIVALFIYAIVMFIQWLAKGNRTSRIIERDIVEETIVQPVQTQTFNPAMAPRNLVGLGSMSAGGSTMGAGAAARVNSGGGGKASH